MAVRWQQKCLVFAYIMGESVFWKLFKTIHVDGWRNDESETRTGETIDGARIIHM
jgi:hypothetical protein